MHWHPTCLQHANCTLRVTVLPTTTSPDGGHKFKVSGLMTASSELHGGDWFRTGTHFASEQVFEKVALGESNVNTEHARR